MMKRYAVYRTASAPASRKLGAAGLALALTAFLAMRFGVIDADVFVLSLVVSAVIAFAALVLALHACNRIWIHGGPGVPAALTGTIFGLLALGPPALVVAMLVLRPGTQDLSTDRLEPPEVNAQSLAAEQPFLGWFDDAVQQHVWPSVARWSGSAAAPDGGTQQRFPDIVSRRYRISTAQLHAAGAKALDTLNWKVVDELPPDLLDAPTRLQAEGTSRILGLKHDVTLRIRPDPVGALLDVRARSRTPLNDISGNPDHIRNVFAEIDRVLLDTYGDLARLAVDETVVEEELQPEPDEELRDTIPLPGFKPYVEEDDTPAPDGPDLTDLEG
ncbi:DUF1499 domain-containing protein [Roseibium sp.]|uniref:DUF1499 domain-containing protein n=1 Tax=Roseibium sp. TaxID=1936156 RepID=UPI003267310E